MARFPPWAAPGSRHTRAHTSTRACTVAARAVGRNDSRRQKCRVHVHALLYFSLYLSLSRAPMHARTHTHTHTHMRTHTRQRRVHLLPCRRRARKPLLRLLGCALQVHQQPERGVLTGGVCQRQQKQQKRRPLGRPALLPRRVRVSDSTLPPVHCPHAGARCEVRAAGRCVYRGGAVCAPPATCPAGPLAG